MSDISVLACKNASINAVYCDSFKCMICNKKLLTNCHQLRIKLCHRGADKEFKGIIHSISLHQAG